MDWEALAELDPLWAILSDPRKRFGQWNLDEFFASGEEEIASALARAAQHGLPAQREVAVDIGCGVGRLTRALARRFTSAVGVDISARMIERARELNRAVPNCRFELSADPDLGDIPDASADIVYSVLVLQHLPEKRVIERHVASFLRIVRPGGVVIFQVPTGMPLRRRLQIRPRVYRLLRRLGFRDEYLYNQLRLTPIRMNWLAHNRLMTIVQEGRGKIVAAIDDGRAGPGIASRTYTVAKL